MGCFKNGVKHHNQLTYHPVLTNLGNKGFTGLTYYGKKMKNSGRSQSPAQTQNPQKAHPHPRGGGGVPGGPKS